MSTKKRVYCDKWDVTILEQVAASCNIAANARTETDWQLFLRAVYDGIGLLSPKQRAVILLSQEFGLSFVDISRVLNITMSMTVRTLQAAVDKLVFFLKSRSLTRKDLFDSKAMQLIYTELIDLEDVANEPADFEFLERYHPPWFYDKNYLFEEVYGSESASASCHGRSQQAPLAGSGIDAAL